MIEVSEKILEEINNLDVARRTLRVRAEDKANAIGNYRKSLAKTLIQLKNGIEFEHEGHKVIKPTATASLAIAHGICFKEKIHAELSESLYKNAIVTLDAIKTNINALQSIMKYQKEIDNFS